MDRPPLPLLLAVAVALQTGCRRPAPAPGPAPAERSTAEAPPPAEVGPLAHHVNARFGFVVVYPRALLTPVWPPPERQTASRGFAARGGGAALRAFGRHLRPDESLGRIRHRTVASYDTVAYETTLDGAFVVSGFRDDRIAYTKVVLRGPDLLTLELEYDRAHRALYDRVVEAVAPLFPGDPAAAAPRRYHNARFDFALVYPAGLLHPQPPSADGGSFAAPDSAFVLRTWGRHDPTGAGLDGLRREAALDTVTFQTAPRNGFVVSGFRGGRIVYLRALRRPNGDVLALEMEYAPAHRATYDRVVERVARSFPHGSSP